MMKFANLYSVCHYLSRGVTPQTNWDISQFCEFKKEFIYKYEHLRVDPKVKQDYSSHSIRVLYGYANPFVQFIKNERHHHYVGALDYSIRPDHLQIEYLYADDKREPYTRDHQLEVEDAVLLKDALIDRAIHVAKEHGKKKVVIDVHQNLRIFHRDYEPRGFVATKRKCSDNPFWVEADLELE